MINEVREGTVVHATEDQWRPSPGGTATGDTHLVVLSAFRSHEPRLAWVYAHTPACAWPTPTCGRPFCQEVLVDLDVVLNAAKQGRQR